MMSPPNDVYHVLVTSSTDKQMVEANNFLQHGSYANARADHDQLVLTEKSYLIRQIEVLHGQTL